MVGGLLVFRQDQKKYCYKCILCIGLNVFVTIMIEFTFKSCHFHKLALFLTTIDRKIFVYMDIMRFI